MDDEKLIECVREYIELYDMSQKKYSDNLHKEKLWRKIGSQLNMPGPTCKARWVSLRDQLRKALKKKITKSGQAANTTKKWKYEDCMSFIIPYFKERETKSNIGDSEISEEESNDGIEINDGGESGVEHSLTEDEKVCENKGENTRKRQNVQYPTRTSPRKMPPPSFSKVKKTSKPDTASSVLMKYLIDSENETSQSSLKNDPIDLFFQGLAATVKTFTPEYQHMAKTKLFSIVSALEWEQLKKNNSQQNAPAMMLASTSQSKGVQPQPAQHTMELFADNSPPQIIQIPLISPQEHYSSSFSSPSPRSASSASSYYESFNTQHISHLQNL